MLNENTTSAGTFEIVKTNHSDHQSAQNDETIAFGGKYRLTDGAVGQRLRADLPIEVLTSSAAFGLRTLDASYTGPLVKVRRSSDNAEQDIGADTGGNIDTASLLAFVGSVDGFVTTWFDQSGDSRDAIQTNQSDQPRLVAGGVIETKDGKPTLVFDSAQTLIVPAFVRSDYSILATAWQSSSAFRLIAQFSTVTEMYFGNTAEFGGGRGLTGARPGAFFEATNRNLHLPRIPYNENHVYSVVRSSTNSEFIFGVNGRYRLDTVASNSNNQTILIGSTGAFGWNGGITEFIIAEESAWDDVKPAIDLMAGHVGRPVVNLRNTWHLTFSGDSLTQGWPAPFTPYFDFAELVQPSGEGFTRFEDANGGAGFNPLRLPVIPNGATPQNHAESGITIIWGGTNDLFFGDDSATAVANAQAWIAANNHDLLVMLTALPRTNPGTPAGFEAERLAFNNEILTNAVSLWGVDAVVDVAAIPVLQDSTDTTYYADAVHLTAAGYQVVADAVYDTLNQLI